MYKDAAEQLAILYLQKNVSTINKTPEEFAKHYIEVKDKIYNVLSKCDSDATIKSQNAFLNAMEN